MAAITYTVKRGDNLWNICSSTEWGPKISGNSVTAKINTVVSLNGISNPNLIYPDQQLILSSSGGASASSSTTQPSNCVTIEVLNLKADSTTGRDVFASWVWTNDQTKGYKIRWEWDKTISGVTETQYEESETSTPGIRYATFTVPDEVRSYNNWVQVFITPIANFTKDAEGNDTKTPHWTADQVGKQYHFKDNPPFIPDAPTCEIDNTTLTMNIESVKKETDAASIIFQVIKDNTSVIYTSPAIPVVAVTDDYGTVSHQYTVPLGSKYKARAKAVASNGKESGWTDFSNDVVTKPSAPTITTCRCNTRSDDSISVYLEWEAVSTADTYKVEYTTVIEDFDNSTNHPQSAQTTDNTTRLEVAGLESGKKYYFRVRSVNETGDESDPSSVVELAVGEPPAAPTTWSSTNSAFEGDPMELNWIHNSVDGSKQTYAELSLKIGDDDWVSYVYKNSTDENSGEEIVIDNEWMYGQGISYKGSIYFKMDTSLASLQNKKIQWKVRTAGVTNAFSESAWSVERTIYIYEDPEMEMSMTTDALGETGLITTLQSFPFYVNCSVNVNTSIQKPVGYYIRIVSNEHYITADDDGTTKTVNKGDSVYERYFDTDGSLSEEISANDVDFESGISYTLYCTVDMSTGLTLTGKHEFDIRWTDATYNIQAIINVDKNTYAATISPYCIERISSGPGGKNLFNINAVVDGNFGTYTVDGNLITFNYESNYDNYFPFAYWLDVKPNTDYTVSIGHCTSIASIFGYTDKLSGTQIFEKQAATIPGSITFNSGDNNRILLGFYSVTDYRDTNTLKESIFDIQIEVGSKVTDYENYYESYVDGGFVENVTLSVYRREFDGTYTKIASGIPNTNTAIVDPHPSLDYARYRIVAKDNTTGAISFYDAPGYPVKCSSIIIQWSESWRTFEIADETSAEGPYWSGSLLKLAYNIDVSDARERSVSAVEYAGREHPVTYYGTHINESPSWTTVIPKEDKETIYALRRLSIWSGDAYIREPSGMGYWANVRVSFNQKHKDVTIPVTLNIKRVEGGV